MSREMREVWHSMDAGEQGKLRETSPERFNALRRATYSEHVQEMTIPAPLALQGQMVAGLAIP